MRIGLTSTSPRWTSPHQRRLPPCGSGGDVASSAHASPHPQDESGPRQPPQYGAYGVYRGVPGAYHRAHLPVVHRAYRGWGPGAGNRSFARKPARWGGGGQPPTWGGAAQPPSWPPRHRHPKIRVRGAYHPVRTPPYHPLPHGPTAPIAERTTHPSPRTLGREELLTPPPPHTSAHTPYSSGPPSARAGTHPGTTPRPGWSPGPRTPSGRPTPPSSQCRRTSGVPRLPS